MYKEQTVAVIIPAYNEEKLIGQVIDTMPEFVDCIIVVDDKSIDGTVQVVKRYIQNIPSRRIECIEHTHNAGTGAARISGLKRACQESFDLVAMMDGDGQMDPSELIRLLDPIANGKTDVVKGNRLFSGEAWKIIPKSRYLGNSVLSLLTKMASGYWHIADSQSGYFAISGQILKLLSLETLYTNYGFPNDFLIHLNIIDARVRDVPIRPIYHIGEQSNLKISSAIPRISYLLLRRFLWRMKEKYVIRDFHPLVFFYFMSFLLFLIDIPLAVRALLIAIETSRWPPINFLTVVFLTSTAIQFLLFAMWFDMDRNKHLK